jgi:hypothetical protein
MNASDKTKDGGWRWERKGCRVYSGEMHRGRLVKIADVGIASCDESELEARGRLIAAAPDGLAFAQHYDAYMSANYSEGPSSSALHPTAAETWRLARSFISKATGDA